MRARDRAAERRLRRSAQSHGEVVLRVAPLLLLLVSAVQEKRPNVLIVITDDQGFGDLGVPRQPGDQDAEARRLRKGAMAEELLRLPGLLADAVEPAHRAVQLPHRRRGYVHRPVDDAAGREDAGRVPRGRRATAPGSSASGTSATTTRFGPKDQGFQETLMLQGGGIGQPSDPRAASTTAYRRSSSKRQARSRRRATAPTSSPTRRSSSSRQRPGPALLRLRGVQRAPWAPRGPGRLPRGLQEPGPRRHDGARVRDGDEHRQEPRPADEDARRARAGPGHPRDLHDGQRPAASPRYNGELRGLKGTVFEGGIRVPAFSGGPRSGRPGVVGGVAAHIDVTPTLLEACRGLEAGVGDDGRRSMLPRWARHEPVPTRTLFFQWHRGDVPEKYRACAALGPNGKLVWTTPTAKPMLFKDPQEKKDVVTASTARKMIWRTAKSTDVNSRHIPYPTRAGTFRPDGREVAQATSVLAMALAPRRRRAPGRTARHGRGPRRDRPAGPRDPRARPTRGAARA